MASRLMPMLVVAGCHALQVHAPFTTKELTITPIFSCTKLGGRHPSPALALTEQEFASPQDEIDALKAQLQRAEGTIASLQSATEPIAEQHEEFKGSRFPLFRRVQKSVEELILPKTRDDPAEGHLAFQADEEASRPPAKGAAPAPADVSGWSVEQVFAKYDVDASGLLDVEEFRAFVAENVKANVISVERLVGTAGAMAQDTASAAENMAQDIGAMAQDTANAAENMAQDMASAVIGRVNDLTGASTKVPVTLVGGVGSGYRDLLASGKGVPVEALIAAVERQSALSSHLGSFMQLIVRVDEANMKNVRDSWERHGRPATLRELLAAEVAEGVIEPSRLKESASLSLLWSMRMKRFWVRVADGFADQTSTEPTSAFGIRAYEAEVEPYHGFVLKSTFRTGLRALPSRKEMLGKMAMAPWSDCHWGRWPEWEAAAAAGADLTPDERAAACLAELKGCSEATRRVADLVQAQLDEFGLRDERKV